MTRKKNKGEKMDNANNVNNEGRRRRGGVDDRERRDRRPNYNNQRFNKNNPNNFWPNRNRFNNDKQNHYRHDRHDGDRRWNHSNYSRRINDLWDVPNTKEHAESFPNNAQFNNDQNNYANNNIHADRWHEHDEHNNDSTQNMQNPNPAQCNTKLRFDFDNDLANQQLDAQPVANELDTTQNNNADAHNTQDTTTDEQSLDKTNQEERNFKKFRDNAAKNRIHGAKTTDETKPSDKQQTTEANKTLPKPEEINQSIVPIDLVNIKQEGKKQVMEKETVNIKQERKKPIIDKESSSSSESEEEEAAAPAVIKAEKLATKKENTITAAVKIKQERAKKQISKATDTSESSEDDDSDSTVDIRNTNDTKNKRSSEDDLVCLGNVEKQYTLDDDENGESDVHIGKEKSKTEKKTKKTDAAADEKCLICDKKNHTSFQCQMICKNCSEPYHGLKNCPKPANVSVMLQSFMEFCMQQITNFVPNQQFQLPNMLPHNYPVMNAMRASPAPSSVASKLKKKHKQLKATTPVSKKKSNKKKRTHESSESDTDDKTASTESSEDSNNEDIIPMLSASKSAMKKINKRKRKTASTSTSESEDDSDDDTDAKQLKKSTTKKQKTKTAKNKKLTTPLKPTNMASFAHTMPTNAYNPMFLNQMLQTAFSPHQAMGFKL